MTYNWTYNKINKKYPTGPKCSLFYWKPLSKGYTLYKHTIIEKYIILYNRFIRTVKSLDKLISKENLEKSVVKFWDLKPWNVFNIKFLLFSKYLYLEKNGSNCTRKVLFSTFNRLGPTWSYFTLLTKCKAFGVLINVHVL